MNSPSDTQGFIDHAAGQSDRWLFVAVLVIGGIAIYLSVRWIAIQYQQILNQWRADMATMQSQQVALHADRVKAADSFAAELRDIQKANGEIAKEYIKAQGEALSKNAEVMGGVQNALRSLQDSCAIARGSYYPPPPRHGGVSAAGIAPANPSA